MEKGKVFELLKKEMGEVPKPLENLASSILGFAMAMEWLIADGDEE